MFERPLGAYDFFSKEISYYRGLDKYPDLKEMVLQHEFNHTKDKNMAQVLWREFTEYPVVYFSDEMYEFFKAEGNKYKQNAWQMFLTMLMTAMYGIIVNIYSFILTTFSMFYFIGKQLREKKGDKNSK